VERKVTLEQQRKEENKKMPQGEKSKKYLEYLFFDFNLIIQWREKVYSNQKSFTSFYPIFVNL
jgi:23S rRNA A1618 N6-methylase RlmF